MRSAAANGWVEYYAERKFFSAPTFNGVNVHALLNFTHGRHALSLMVKGPDPGMRYSIAF